MTKSDLCVMTSKASGHDQRKTMRVIESLLILLSETMLDMTEKDAIQLRGHFTFTVKDRKARPARNVRTGEVVTVKAHRRVVFRAPGRLRMELRKGIG